MPDWRRMLEEIDADLSALEASKAELLDVRARIEARMAKEAAGTNELLHTHSQSSTVNDVNPTTARLNMSRAKSGKDPFAKACREKKLTQNGLAKRLRFSASLLSMYRQGERPIPEARAKAVEALIGWPADKEHWPGGIVQGD